jgi:hypothetical protein
MLGTDTQLRTCAHAPTAGVQKQIFIILMITDLHERGRVCDISFEKTL